MRVNMDSSIVSDPRFKLVALALDVKWTEVVGSCFLVWLACYDRRSTCLRKVEADLAAEISGFSDALIDENLADDMGDGVVRIHGVEERIKFLIKQAESGSKGGKSKGKNKGKQSPGKKKASAQAPASESAQANTHTLTPDHSHTLTPDQSLSHAPSDAPAKRSPITQAMLERVYGSYPKKTGRAKGLAKAKKVIVDVEDFQLFEKCVLVMAEKWHEKDTQFCPGFEPFVNGKRWQDEDWPLPDGQSGGQSGRSGDRAQGIWDRSERMRREEEAAEAAESKEGTGGVF